MGTKIKPMWMEKNSFKAGMGSIKLSTKISVNDDPYLVLFASVIFLLKNLLTFSDVWF